MKQVLTNWEWRHVLGNQSIDEDWNTVENKIHEVTEKFVLRKRHFKNSHKRAEWMDADTSAKIIIIIIIIYFSTFGTAHIP